MTTETITNDETRAAAAQDYNGWKNRQTWNCALWIGNDLFNYRAAVAFMQKYKGRAPYYRFITSQGMDNDKTPDGFKWLSKVVCLQELNDMMRELIA